MVVSHEVVMQQALAAMVAFEKTFGCELSKDKLAEVYVARLLNLKNLHGNNYGFDATSENGERYQIKYRAHTTLNVDANNFDFDYVILVHMDADYRVTDVYRLTQPQAREIFVRREKFNKWQATQNKCLSMAERLVLNA